MRNTLNPIYRNLILAFSSMLIFSLFIVQYSHGATNPQGASSAAPKNCQTLLSRTEKAADSVPEVMAQFIKNEILFNYSKTFSLTSKWCNANRSNLGSKNPKRQAESGLDAVLIKDNGELRSEFELWYNLAEFQWNEILHYGFFPENIMRLLSFITKHEPSQTEFISLYALLLREYLSAIKGSSKSLTQQYSKVFDEYKAPVGSSPFREDMKVGVPLGIAAGAGILAMHFAFGAITLVPDLVLLATAGPSATLLPSGYRLVKNVITSFQPAKYLNIYKGEELYKALDEIFGAKLHRGYKSHMYWSLHIGAAQNLTFANTIDLDNYKPDFTTLGEAEVHLNGISAEILIFNEDFSKSKIELNDTINSLLTLMKSFKEQVNGLAKNNSPEIKLNLQKILTNISTQLNLLIEKETQFNLKKKEKSTKIQAALSEFTKRLDAIYPLLQINDDATQTNAQINRLSSTAAGWTEFTILMLTNSMQTQSFLNKIKEISDAIIFLSATSSLDPQAINNGNTAIIGAITILESWRTSLLVNKSEQ